MKWAYATTAAIVRCLQKDQFYRQQIESDLKLILLDHLDVGVYLRIEDWLPVLVDLFYYSALTGCGKRTLGEAYSSIIPVETVQRRLFLPMRLKRMLWVLLGVLIPHALKRSIRSGPWKILLEFLSELKTILFYLSGKFPSFTNKFLSIRYVFYPRRPPVLDEDALIYKGLAVALGIVSVAKLKEFFRVRLKEEVKTTKKEKNNRRPLYKCPVCLDPISSSSFASTKCGHVYCWQCISKWMFNINEDDSGGGGLLEGSCPVCRVRCDPPDLLPLANI